MDNGRRGLLRMLAMAIPVAAAAPSYFFAPAGGWLQTAYDTNGYFTGLDLAARRDIAASRLLVYGRARAAGLPIMYSNDYGVLIPADGEILALWVDGAEMPEILNTIRPACGRAGC